MSTPHGIEVVTRHGKRSRLRAIAIASLAIMCGAGSYRFAVDVLHWRKDSVRARSIGSDPTRSVEDVRNAIVVMQRDAYDSVQLLKQIAAAGGENAKHAENALRTIGVTPR